MRKFGILLGVLLLIGAAAYVLWPKVPFKKASESSPLEKVRIANVGMFSHLNILAVKKGIFLKRHCSVIG